MIGFENQKLIAFFVLLGLFSFLPLLKKEGIDILPLVQIYLGGFIALFFSFNQYYLIKIDIDAGMIHNNYLRALPYTRIIINRWLVSLILHIITLLISILVVYVSGIKFSLEKILYIIVLNIFCSLLNLMFAVVILINAAANMLLILFVYGQLIDDVQRFISKYPLIQSFNIFSPLLMESETSIELWAFLLLAIFLVFTTIIIKLNKLKYDTLILD